MIWTKSHRFSPSAVKIADRHYNRQKPGTPQFVPPGRGRFQDQAPAPCGLPHGLSPNTRKHEWAGAWINSCFRKECDGVASEFILQAIAATRFHWDEVPELGCVTFVDASRTPGIVCRGEKVHGYCYQRAGFHHVGFTKGGLWAWQLLPHEMPAPVPALGMQLSLV